MRRKGSNSPATKIQLIALAIIAAAFVLYFFVCSPIALFADTQKISPSAILAENDSAVPELSEQPPATPASAAPSPTNDTADSPAVANPETEPPIIIASDITDTLTVTLTDASPAAALLDRSYATKRTFGAHTSIGIASTQQIHSIYLIWDLPPGDWTLVSGTAKIAEGGTRAGRSGTESKLCGTDGFIHEYIAMPSPALEASVLLPSNGATVCDIYAFSEGYPPDWVQAWLPPLDKADLLVVPTHADDEHLFFVGTIPYYAGERGYQVQVAYMTNHWNEPPRPHELLDGLWTAGARNYPVISNFGDRYAESLQDAQAIYGQSNIVDFHVELLRRFKPSVVVGHDLNGEYGHGAHMLNAVALMEAVENAASSGYHASSYERYGVWDTPKLYLHMYGENAVTMDWDAPLESFGGATAREIAVKAYDCHVSQHRWSFAVPLSGPTGSVFGLVRTLVGPDIEGGDLFENLNYQQKPPKHE